MLDSLTKKQKIIFFIILFIMLAIIIYYIYYSLYSNELTFYDDTNLISNNNLVLDSPINISDEKTNTLITVYICGEVKENKVVTLLENSRVCDAIDAAGGLTTNADLEAINLASVLEDGEKIYIPKIGEEVTQKDTSSFSTGKININKASQTELETIPGIGPSTALKIINYRKENGKFSKIEDIKNVSGIGDGKYEQIKEYISVK